MKKIIFSLIVGVLIGSMSAFALSMLPKPFPDVDYNDYYFDAVSWMKNSGITSGYQNGNFGPNDAITRGQFAQMLYNYNKYSVEVTNSIVDAKVDMMLGALGNVEMNTPEVFYKEAAQFAVAGFFKLNNPPADLNENYTKISTSLPATWEVYTATGSFDGPVPFYLHFKGTGDYGLYPEPIGWYGPFSLAGGTPKYY